MRLRYAIALSLRQSLHTRAASTVWNGIRTKIGLLWVIVVICWFWYGKSLVRWVLFTSLHSTHSLFHSKSQSQNNPKENIIYVKSTTDSDKYIGTEKQETETKWNARGVVESSLSETSSLTYLFSGNGELVMVTVTVTVAEVEVQSNRKVEKKQ